MLYNIKLSAWVVEWSITLGCKPSARKGYEGSNPSPRIMEINKNLYQVFVFSCHASMPVSFASHSWLVINKKGAVSRWEVLFIKSGSKTSWGHLHLNFHSPFQGLEIFYFYPRLVWKSYLIGFIEGNENSTAHQIANFIENSPKSYPYCYEYLLWGPNSNTYTQWVLDKFPEFKINLPWNSFGKNF